MAVTITDIAKMANVSIATVSRVVNGSDKVSTETFNRVTRLIEKHNYIPNTAGRSLRQAKTNRILVIAHSNGNPFYVDVLEGVQKVARASGYSTLVRFVSLDEEGAASSSRLFLENTVDGAIIMVERNAMRKALEGFPPDAPVVQCSEHDPTLPYPYVRVDDVAAARRATEYLIHQGHRDIGLFNFDTSAGYGVYREEGYCGAMNQNGLPVRADRILHLKDISYNTAYTVARNCLRNKDRPTAFFAVTDYYAAALINAAQSLGLRVPQDLSVIGFDNMDISWMMSPGITTVGQPRYRIGSVCASLLLQMLEGVTVSEKEHIVETELIIRGSASAPGPKAE